MKRFMIERDINGVGDFSLTELCGAARASNQALSTIGPRIQWQHSYVASELSGIPVSKITEVRQVIDPLTANN
jgi:hypothetical protein